MRKSVRYLLPLLATVVLAGSGCTSTPGAASSTTPALAPAAAVAVADTGEAWLRTELYFSIGEWTETSLNTEPEARWQDFLDREVTPRFPDGLSVIDVYGQWRNPQAGAAVRRERSRLLVVVHPDAPDASAKIEEIREAWKKQTGEKSVLRVSQPARVAF